MEEKIENLLESDSWENKLLGMQLAKSQNMEDFLMSCIDEDECHFLYQRVFIFFGSSLYLDSEDFVDTISNTVRTKYTLTSEVVSKENGNIIADFFNSPIYLTHVYFECNQEVILQFFEDYFQFRIKQASNGG